MVFKVLQQSVSKSLLVCLLYSYCICGTTSLISLPYGEVFYTILKTHGHRRRSSRKGSGEASTVVSCTGLHQHRHTITTPAKAAAILSFLFSPAEQVQAFFFLLRLQPRGIERHHTAGIYTYLLTLIATTTMYCCTSNFRALLL